MAEILTVTLNPTIDISSEAEVVRPTRKTRTVDTRQSPGGGGINVARVIAALGGQADAVYLAGGEIGALLDRLLTSEGIHHQHIAIAGQTRIGYMVRERSTGLEYRFVPAGPTVDSHELQPCFQAVESHRGRYVVASGSLPQGVPADAYARIAHIATARAARFVLDSSGIGLQATLEKSKAFLVKPSFGELEHLVGRTLSQADASEAAAGIVARGAAEYVAVTMGADGALLASSAGVIHLPAIHVRVRSTVGTGDSFLGAMIWALSENKTPEAAFRLGLAAGAAAAMTPGNRLCQRDDVFELYRRAGGT
ncbi:MAG: hexose kinase [Rhizobiales bacterium]|nr:hexose kinase [Hyphomicrobiales bacterium]MBI3674865.1 hexose kinase [Hyphomicrobiales bacterium]